MTPVVVSVIKEALQKPLQSEAVRRSATSARRVVAGSAAARTQSAQSRSPAVGTVPTPPPPSNGSKGELTQGDVLLTHPRRSYGAGPRAPLQRHWKVAVITGLLAFVVAAVVLTVPELVFGGSVSGGGHRTTIFGGKSEKPQKSDEQKTNTDQQQQAPQGQTTPQQTPSQPEETPTQPEAQPQQPPSSGAPAPAPSAPAPSAPPAPSP